MQMSQIEKFLPEYPKPKSSQSGALSPVKLGQVGQVPPSENGCLRAADLDYSGPGTGKILPHLWNRKAPEPMRR
jgi:hypothetical protein